MWLGFEGVVQSVGEHLLRAVVMGIPCGFSEAFLEEVTGISLANHFQQNASFSLHQAKCFHRSITIKRVGAIFRGVLWRPLPLPSLSHAFWRPKGLRLQTA
jgi:hypothetical protein